MRFVGVENVNQKPHGVNVGGGNYGAEQKRSISAREEFQSV